MFAPILPSPTIPSSIDRSLLESQPLAVPGLAPASTI
jgi:hypothetical protein